MEAWSAPSRDRGIGYSSRAHSKVTKELGGVKCTEEDRRFNNQTEIRITSFCNFNSGEISEELTKIILDFIAPQNRLGAIRCSKTKCEFFSAPAPTGTEENSPDPQSSSTAN
jgi:hypothetical protein